MYERDIRIRARQGCMFKFIISDPSIIQNDERLAEDARNTLTRILDLQQNFPGKIEVRLAKTILHCSIIAIDHKTRNGLIQVELYSSADDVEVRPHFDLSSSTEPRWYAYYKEQTDKLWGSLQAD
jgi:hypothetical protein